MKLIAVSFVLHHGYPIVTSGQTSLNGTYDKVSILVMKLK